MSDDTPTLLAVDLGLRSGLALYDRSGRLQWYRSTNFGSRSRLKKGAYSIMRDARSVAYVVMEGGGALAPPWEKEAARREATLIQIQAGRWRERLLLPSERRSSHPNKYYADGLARSVIAWSDASPPTSLRHDAAEAILVGLWGVLEVGWLDAVPKAVRSGRS